jgi:hypothetical protein
MPAALGLLVTCLAAFGVFVAVWPWLWADVPARIREHLGVYRSIAAGGASSWQLFPFQEAWVRTPPVVLGLVGAGMIALVAWSRARERRPAVLLLLLWLAVPLVRSAVPGFRNYDGIRRFLEFLPPLMIVAGAAVGALVDLFARRARPSARVAIAAVLAVLACAHSIWIDVRLHPHQTSYLNPWRGGIAPEDYSGNSLRTGIAWLNENAITGADVAVPVAPWILDIVAPVVLRRDLRSASGAITMMEAGPIPVTVSRPPASRRIRYVMILNRPGWSDRVRQAMETTGREIHRIEVDGTPILLVFALEPEGPKIEAR